VYINEIVHVVPQNFIFDFASVPRGFWNIVPPYDPKYAAPALVHDWLYATEMYPRKIADDIFLDAMEVRGVSWWKRQAMYMAVRAFGGSAYNHTRDEVQRARSLAGIHEMRRPLWGEVRTGAL
jgi:hypothetical protein